jgi:acyl carrier protein
MRADGLLEFLGRKDTQVKIHGQRIEAAEIESVLLETDGVKQAAVTSHVDAMGENYLVAYIVPQTSSLPPSSMLRQSVAGRLPASMVPSRFVAMDSLPLTTSGKLDRKALPAPQSLDPADEAQSGESTIEEILRIVSRVISSDSLTADSNLLQLGASSIDMVRILNSLECRYRFRPTIDEFYREPTVSALSATVSMERYVARVDGSEVKTSMKETSTAPWFLSAARERGVTAEDRSMEYEEGAL